MRISETPNPTPEFAENDVLATLTELAMDHPELFSRLMKSEWSRCTQSDRTEALSSIPQDLRGNPIATGYYCRQFIIDRLVSYTAVTTPEQVIGSR